MAVWSSVDFSTAWTEQRFDPEFWQPTYLENQHVTKKWPLLGAHLLSTQYGLSREMNDAGFGIPIYRMDEIEGLFLTRPEKYVEITDDEKASLLLSMNDVLFNRTNSTKFVGRTGILKDNVVAVFASYLIRLVPDAGSLLPEYLAVYLNCPTGIKLVKRRAKESINQTNISGSEIRKVPIFLASDKVQRQVAALVDEAATYRSKMIGLYIEAEVEMLDRLGWAKLTQTQPELWYAEAYGAIRDAGRFDAEHFHPQFKRLREHLAGLGSKPVGDFCPMPRRGVQPVFIDRGDVSVIDSKAVRPGSVEPSHEEKTSLAFYNDPKNTKARVQHGDVLLNSTGRGTLGRAASWLRHDPAMADNHVAILRPHHRSCLPVYLALFLNSPPGLAQSEMFQTGSSGQLELYPSDVFKLIVYLPANRGGKIDLEWQQRLADKVFGAADAKGKVRSKMREAIDLVERAIESQVA